MSQQDPLTVLLIQTEDQRFDDLSCLGHRVLRMPNIDKPAEGGRHARWRDSDTLPPDSDPHPPIDRRH